MRQFMLYAVIRLGLWALIWWLLTLLGVGVMLAGVLAALIAMLLSILFLDRLRDSAAMRWKDAHERRVERRGVKVDEDAEYEDSLFGDSEDSGASMDAEASADSGSAQRADDGEDATGPRAEASAEGSGSAAQLPDLDPSDGVREEDR